MPIQPRPARFSRPILRIGVALFGASLLVACGSGDGPDQAGHGAPPEVAVVTVEPQTVRVVAELPGRLEASRIAQVRARATGILLERAFEEGSDVKAGELLFRIDRAPYEAALQSAQAQLAQARARLAEAQATAARYEPLVDAEAVSQQEYDAVVAAKLAAEAQVEAGKAAIRTAEINLGYASVTAPIAGRIGRSLVTEGALVSQQEGTHLATVQQIDPLYVNLTQPALEVLQLREAVESGAWSQAADGAAQVEILLENGQPAEHAARLLFTDLSVDPGTGQVSLRAEMPNPGGHLLPGMYVRVRLQQASIDDAVLLPLQAVNRGGPVDVVMVVGSDGSVNPRPVTVHGTHEGQWVITDGLEAGEMVLVEGIIKVAMGASQVTPVAWSGIGAAAADGGDAPASN